MLIQGLPLFSRVTQARTNLSPAEALRASHRNPAPDKSARNTELSALVSPPPVVETITDAVISRHKPTLSNGRIEGSLRVLLGESFTIPNAASITSNVYLPGAPSVQVNNGAQHGGIVSDEGASTPNGYTLTLANNANLPGSIHTHADAIELPAVATSVPPATGTRTVTVSSQAQVATIGDWQTVRDLNLNGSHITVDMPPGNYGTLTINGNSQVNLSAGTYNFANTFNLDGSAKLQATGALVINVGRDLKINSGALTLGSFTSPADVRLNVLGAQLNIKGSSQVSALVSAYNGHATLSGTSQVRGRVIADALTLNGGTVFGAVWPVLSGSAMTLFGPRRFDRTSGQPNQYVEQFSLPAGTTAPYTLHIQNGSLDGVDRVSSATIKVNGVSILTQSDLNETVASLDRTITLSALNQLDVSLASDPGSYLIIYITGMLPGTDTTPPVLTVTTPENNYTTPQTQITFSGTAADAASGIAHVYVNDVEASYNSADNTWTLANVPLATGPNSFVVRAVDQAGNETTVPLTVNREAPENHSPTVDPGTEQTITLPNTAALDGNATDDGLPEGGSLTTTWAKVSGPGDVTFADEHAVSTTASFSTHGTYVLSLTASDGALSTTKEVTITVEPQNQPPTVNAGVDQRIALPSTATLDGTVTDDGLPSGSTVTTLWTHVSGPGTVMFEDPTLTDTVATFSDAGEHVLKLTATDGELTTHSEVRITVDPVNQAPTVAVGDDQRISLPASAQLNGTASDDGWPFGSTLTTTWAKVSGPGTVTFAAPNVTVTTASFSAPGNYVLSLTATDGQLSTTKELNVEVTPPNQAPVVSAGEQQTVSLPGATATLNGSAADDGLPFGSTLIVLWTKTSGPGDVIFDNPNQAATTAHFTIAGDYLLRLTASDGALSNFAEVLVKVTAPNQAPSVSAGSNQTVVLPASANLNGSVSDDDLPLNATVTTVWSKVSGPGTVTFANPNVTVTTASFSVDGTYVLRLTATDTQYTNFAEITINVEPVNQAPAVNAGANQTITLPASAVLHGTVTDDGYPSGSSVTVLWTKVSGPGTVTFSAATSVDTNASFSVAGNYVLRLTATDSQLTTPSEVQVNVIAQNFAPTVNAGADQTVSLPASASLNGSVSDDGLPAGSTLTTLWTKVSGPGDVTFGNASVTVTTASFSAAGPYVLRLTASDSELSTSAELTVNVIDPRVPPSANFMVPQSTGAAGGFVIAVSGGTSADSILDSSNATSWTTSGQSNQFAKIQFYDQQSVFLDRVRLQSNQGGTSISTVKDFDVQVSATTSDDASFVTVLSATYVNNGQLQEFVFPGGPARARFVKFIPKNNHAGSGNIQIGTFNPVGTGSIDSILSLPANANGALSQSPALPNNGATVHSFSYSGGTNTATGLIGYAGGGWTTTSLTNQFAIVELAGNAPVTIKGVKVASGLDAAERSVKDFEVWVSSTTPDAASFTRVLSATVPVTAMAQTYLFPGGAVPARYVKYVPLTTRGTATVIDTELFDVLLNSGARVVGVSGEWSGSPTPGEAAFDGDTNSVWFTNVAANSWIKTSLADEAIQKLYGVRIWPQGSISFQEGPKDFEIRVSTTTTDDAAFTTVLTGTVAPTTSGVVQEFLLPSAIDAKYVQFFWKNGYQANRVGVRELEALIYPPRGSALLAFSSQDEAALNCLDLDPQGQVWSTASSQTTNQWLKLLMPRGELANINHIAIRPAIAANGFYNGPKDFDLQVSTTDSADASFVTIFSGTLANNTQLQDFYFATTQARYVRLFLKNGYPAPRIGVASFYVYSANEIGTAVRFFDQSTDADGPIVSWAWDFGDGSTSTDRNPIHTYAQPGNYTVSLTVTDHTGLTNTRQTTYRVLEALRPTFSHTPVIVHEAGESVRFQDYTRLMVLPGAQRRYVFGDGGSLSQSLFTSIYTYQDSGTFTASLSIGDPQGMNHVATRTVFVVNMVPSVNIGPDKTVFWGEAWTIVPQITDQSPNDRGSLQGVWNFADGQTSTCVNCTNANATVTHSYANPGTYNATLTVTDKDGGAGSDTAVFTVSKRPTSVVFTTPLPPAIAGGPITFRARLTDTFGNVTLSGKPIQFVVNGAPLSATTDAAGIAELNVPLPAGTHMGLVTATFAEDDFYQTGSGITGPATAGSTPPPGAQTNAGTDFWLMFTQNFSDINQATQRLFITSPVATSGTVTIPGLNFSQNFTVAANSVTTVNLGLVSAAISDQVESNRGIHVTSQQPVTVYGLNQRTFTSDAFLALPVPALGTDHFVASWGNLSFQFLSEFGIVAPENGTIVTITPSATTGSRLAGVPYNVTLNQGQTYLLLNSVISAAGDLTGSRITANKPIAVFSGHMSANVPLDGGCCADHLVEQIPPTTTWGKRFATVPLASRTKGDVFRYIAAEDGTAVYLNGQLAATINKGQWLERLIKVPTEVITTKPILVAQYSTGIFFDPPASGKADPFLMIVPPYSQFLNHYTITTPPTGFAFNWVNVVAPTAAAGSITLDGTPIPAASFTPIGISGFSGAQVAITVGTHNLDGPSAFGVFTYGYNQDEGYGYPGGMSLVKTVAATNVAVAPETQAHSINTQACVVATFTDQDQIALGGRTVTFSVAGANPLNSTAQTDAGGQATLCYSGANTGTDQLTASLAGSQATATLIWIPPNQAPVVNAGANQTITLPSLANLAGSVTDDGLPAATLNLTWSKVSGPGNVVFANPNSASTSASFSTDGVYVLRLSASDTALTSSADIQITVDPAPPNQAPTANAGPDATATINGNLVLNHGNEQELVNGDIASWTEGQGANWTRANATSGAGFPDPERGSWYFFAGNDAQAELRQDVDVSAFAPSIAAGTQQFEFKAHVRSAVEAAPDGARVVVEYRDAANMNVLAVLDSGVITSTGSWHLTEDLRAAPVGTGWIRIRLIATRNSGTTNDAFFDSISLRSIGNTAIKLHGTASDDGLPFGSSLSTTWTRISGPGAVTFTDAASLTSGALFGVAGTYVLRLTATDGDLSHSDDVTVVVNPINLAPVVNAGANQTINLPAAASLSGTVTDDGQPPDSSLSISWTKVAGPGTVTFANANAAATTATFSTTGTYILRLTGDDTEYSTSADVSLTVNPDPNAPVNQPPSVNPGPNQIISLPTDTVTLSGTVSDDGLPAGSTLVISWTKVSGPGTVTFGNASSATTTAQFSEVGNYVLRLSAGDGQYLASAEVGVNLTAANQAPTAEAGTGETILLSQPAQLNGSASDDGLPSGNLTTLWSKVSGPGDVTFLNPTFTVSGALFSATGTYVLRLTASDGALTGSDVVTITVVDDVAPPTVAIASPDDEGSVTEPTIVTGSVSDGDWTLEHSLASTDDQNGRVWTTISTGHGATTGTLGTIDPTMMLNGLFDIRLSSTDQYGQTSRTKVSVIVEGNLKVGNFTISFTDLSLPVAGVPLEVTRTYDSRDKRIGDFGFGWTLGVHNVRVEKASVLGLRWFETVSQEVFPNYCLQPVGSHAVTVTFPGGKVFKFKPVVAPQCQRTVPITTGTLSFTPMAGTVGKLEVVGSADVQIDGSVPGPVNLLGFGTGVDIFNSFVFKFTAQDGTAYIIDQRTGLSAVSDLNGNTVTIGANGVTHSRGQSIAFVRDGQGRIITITDANSNPRHYDYDANGNLDTYTDAEGNVTKFAYTADHLLQSITVTSADGTVTYNPATTSYENGRLKEQVDAFNRTISYNHDIANRRETITDRLGNQTVFEYDSAGNIVYIRNPEGGETSRTFDDRGNVLTETSAQGTSIFEYDADNNLKQFTDVFGNVTKLTYNPLGQVTSTLDARGNLSTATYNEGNGRLLSVRDTFGNETQYTYNANGLYDAIKRVDHNDPSHPAITTFTYFDNGYLKSETHPLGNVTSYTYDDNGNRKTTKVKRTNGAGQLEELTASFEYDKLNRVVKTIHPDNTFTQVVYTLNGQRSSIKDQFGRETKYDYDALGQLSKVTFPDGRFEEMRYDAEGRRTQTIDRAGRTTLFGYDKVGHVIETLSADGGRSTSQFDLAGRIKEQSRWLDANTKFTTSYAYAVEDHKKIVIVTDGLNRSTKHIYDENGNLSKVIDANNHSTSFEYDANNRCVKIIYPDGTFELRAYDGLGRVTSRTDQAQKTTQYRYDAADRLVTVIDALNHPTSFTYDELGNLITQTDANSHTTRFEYDPLGRRIKRTLPSGVSETITYDLAGNPKTRRDFNGKLTTYDYDSMNRLLQKTPDPSFNAPSVSYTYTATGQRQTMTDATGVTTYAYDELDRLLSAATPRGTLTYSYDKLGNLKTLRSSNANGVSVDYDYDALSRVSSVVDNRLPQGANSTTYTYDNVGNLQSYTYPNAVQTTHTFNSLNRLTEVTSALSSTMLARYTYELAPAGNRLSVTELSGRKVDYGYDATYKLTSETITGSLNPAQNGQISYTYDAVGNRLTRSSLLAVVPNQTLTYDANDRLTSDTYDDNGNTVTANGKTYSFDWENHLESINNGAVTYLYDGDGNRVGKTVGASVTKYLVDTNNLTGYAQVADEVINGAVVRTYTYGHDLISQNQLIGGNWQVSFYGKDGHGSVRYLTSATGAITDTYDYDAFGNLIASTGSTPNERLFGGEQFDANAGFYYLRARYLNADTGRFWSMDTYGGSQYDPLSLHKYLYANANPVTNIDPSGHTSVADATFTCALVGALAGGLYGGLKAGLNSGWNPRAIIWGTLAGAIAGFVAPYLVVYGGTFIATAFGVPLITGIQVAGGLLFCYATQQQLVALQTAQTDEERTVIFVELVVSMGLMALSFTKFFDPEIGVPVSGTPGGPSTPLAPGGGLQAHENAGGHLLGKHVNQSVEALAARLQVEPKISAASTFTDRAAAETAVTAALDANKTQIGSWLESGTTNRMRIDYTSSTPVGITLQRGASEPIPASTFRIILVKDPSQALGYYILTGFPQ
jgi:RHS repeat-associated protein